MSNDEEQPLAAATAVRDGARDTAPTLPGMRVVGVGASAGGLGALKQLFAAVPEDVGVCFVVIVHLSPKHESHLANLLQQSCKIPVRQVTGTTELEANHVYVIPPDANIEAIDTHLHLSELEQQRQKRAPIDHFFRTLADAHGEQAVGVVLTGTGSDGTAGLKWIRERGGLTIVQSPDEAEYDSMPRSAINAGVADLVLALEEIPTRFLDVGRTGTPLDLIEADEAGDEQGDGVLRRILAVIHAHTGHDFAPYRRSTIMRRIARRVQIHRAADLESYLKVLNSHPEEVPLLFTDLLITVTEFFRDPEIFEHLQHDIIPRLFEDKTAEDRVRAWSIGCATGEEAYSLAILLMEEQARQTVPPVKLQVFATDIHESALRKAREGVYPATIEANVSSERLKEFFVKRSDSYRIQKHVRERVVFALHNVLQDPPFSHLHLITCRNLFIYMKRDVQRNVVRMFHYALEEGGYLMVGTAEALDSDLFVCEDKQKGIYRRRSVPASKPKQSKFPVNHSDAAPQRQIAPSTPPDADYGALHEQVVEWYAPPSILINPDGDMVHCSARAGRYLAVPGGTPTNKVYRLLPEQLRLEFRAALHIARDEGRAHRSRPINVTLEGQQLRITIRVHPIDQAEMAGFSLVIFDELPIPEESEQIIESSSTDANNRELEMQLERTEDRMLALIKQHEAAQESMQAYNEELESSNEELRSTMEELETSKEEMQSMNEELSTLNQESVQRVEELDHLSSELHNLLTATHIATVFLDRDMHIMRFTPSMAELFDMRDIDRGRSFTDLAGRLGYEELLEDFQRVFSRHTPVEREVAGSNERFYLARLQCYRTLDDRVEGVVITFIDITERKLAEEQLRNAKNLAEKIINTVNNPMLVLNDELCIQSANQAFFSYFGVNQANIQGVPVYDLNGGQWDNPRLRKQLEGILDETTTVDDFELDYVFFDPNGAVSEHSPRTLVLNARRINKLDLILLSLVDETERRQMRRSLENSHHLLEQAVDEQTGQLRQQANRLQRLVRELSSAEQRERKRMASILHDDLQQLLVAVKIQLEIARSEIGESSVSERLHQAIVHLDESIDATYTLVRHATPRMLYESGLLPTLRWLGEEMLRKHRLTVHIETEAAISDLPISDETKTLLFEGIRELLFNVVKHANVDEANIAIAQDQSMLSITVSDSGRGFDARVTRATTDSSGFGLFSVADRIDAMGGSLSIDSTPNKGTNVCVMVPITTEQDDGIADSSGDTAQAQKPVGDETATAPNPIRVLIADDHAVVRDGVVSVLARDARIIVVGEAADGVDAIAAVDRLHPDVVLMDISMPRMSGIEATREIRRKWPQTQIIGLSMADSDSTEARALTGAGAAGCLRKSDASSSVIETVIAVAAARG